MIALIKHLKKNFLFFCAYFDESNGFIKIIYVILIKLIKVLARITGVFAISEKYRSLPPILFCRSIFSIWDINDLIHLDLPFWTFKSMAAVEKILKIKGDAIVFEYGSGASTVWLAKRCKEVHSVEHDSRWARELKPWIRRYPNIHLLEVKLHSSLRVKSRFFSKNFRNLSFEDYVHQIDKTGKRFDLIIIDGFCRKACFENALKFLKPGGHILFDNSRRLRYQTVLKRKDLHIVRFAGMVPGLPYPSETAIVSKNA